MSVKFDFDITGEVAPPKKILIVDDDPVLLQLLSTALSKRDFQPFTIGDVSQVDINLFISENEIELVLLDLNMPKQNGIDVLRQIRMRHWSLIVPVIIITASTEDAAVIEALEAGANDYIRKPINLDVAIARIRGQLQLSDLSKDLAKSKEMESLGALVTTYNHEIWNPLVIAKGFLRKEMINSAPENLKKISEALNRIGDIIKKIEQVSKKDELETESYANSDTNLITLKKTS